MVKEFVQQATTGCTEGQRFGQNVTDFTTEVWKILYLILVILTLGVARWLKLRRDQGTFPFAVCSPALDFLDEYQISTNRNRAQGANPAAHPVREDDAR